MAPDLDTVALAESEGIVTITLNRPDKRNALTPRDSGLLLELVDGVASSPTARVLVLTGAGSAFCAGADLSATTAEHGQPAVPERLARIQDTVLALARLPQPVIVAVNGVAVGAGLGLALAGDIVVAAETARFSAIFVQRALSLDSGLSSRLPALVGPLRARELALTGRFVEAEEAVRIGLVNSVVPAAELDDVAGGLARDLARSSQTALRSIKQVMTAARGSTLEEALALETDLQRVCASSPEFLAARAAFAAKGR